MTPKEITNFRIDCELLEALRGLRDAMASGSRNKSAGPFGWWVEFKGVAVKTERKRAATRKRS